MKNLLKKSFLLLILLTVTKISFTQPPPPPQGPLNPLTIINNSDEMIVVIVLENDDCTSTANMVSTWYSIQPSSSITVYQSLPSTGTNSPYWAGIATFLWPTMPPIPTMLGNIFSSCAKLSTIQGPGQPVASWMFQYTIEID